MAKIYRTTDRIPLKVDDIEIIISPLSVHQKALVEGAASGGGSSNLLNASMMALKFSLKGIKGLEDSDGKDYELKYDDNGELTDETLDDLFNIEQSTKLVSIALNLVNRVPDSFIDLTTGKPIDGVSFISEKKVAPRKK